MTPLTRIRVVQVLLFLVLSTGGLAAAQQRATVRFSNWEFTPPPMMERVEQTADKLVFKLGKSVPGPGGTLTLQAGQPLQGTLAARLDAEWKRLTKGRKLLEVKPDSQTELMDGSEGLAREATTANGGFFSITVFAAPNNGVNLLQMDAADDMATQMLGGTTVGFFMSIKLHPVGGKAATAAAPAAAYSTNLMSDRLRLNPITRMCAILNGEAGVITVPGHWATWAHICWTTRIGRSNSVNRRASRPVPQGSATNHIHWVPWSPTSFPHEAPCHPLN